MSITATELKMNLSKYLLLAETEDIYITRNGKIVAKLTNLHQERVDLAKSLFGVLSDEISEEDAKKERLDRI
ncbi:MAG: type II toxin-antitoxin system prevent-host-death family antitoxin [Clostridia bacterium]|nr:type II toxin-antitoxin system prevent-host-death family antitoxin [Clostridia bacterium]